MKHFELYNGLKVPVIGAGTFPLKRFELIKMVYLASGLGYTMFDSAAAYYNEKALGYAWRLTLRKRKDLFLISKLSNRQQREGNVQKSFLESLDKLHVRYLDMYLMHWPNPETYISCWKQMEGLYKNGLVKSIGVCNFHQHHLEKLMSQAEIKPMVNEIEVHPLLSQEPLIEYCQKNQIQVIAYTPLARMNKKLIENPVLNNIAEKYNKSVVQIVLRWDYQRGIISIPKSSSKKRLEENISLFDFSLTVEEMEQINMLNEDFRVRNDPDNCDYSKL